MDTIPFLNFSFWLVLKIFVLVALFLYIVFAFVVIRQVKLMTDTLELQLEGILRAIAYLHFAFTIVVFLAALVIL